jgi:hypothetical protein
VIADTLSKQAEETTNKKGCHDNFEKMIPASPSSPFSPFLDEKEIVKSFNQNSISKPTTSLLIN